MTLVKRTFTHAGIVRRVLLLAAIAVTTLGACKSAEEKERQQTAAMVEQAKADAVAETTFVQDSIKIMQSITMDTVERTDLVTRQYIDDDGNTQFENVHQALTRLGARCTVDSVKVLTLAQGDTLSCQWEKQP